MLSIYISIIFFRVLVQLRREFKYIARCDNKSPILLNNWSQWAPKIVAFCRTEPDLPPAMSTLIREYDTVDTNGIHNPTGWLLFLNTVYPQIETTPLVTAYQL